MVEKLDMETRNAVGPETFSAHDGNDRRVSFLPYRGHGIDFPIDRDTLHIDHSLAELLADLGFLFLDNRSYFDATGFNHAFTGDESLLHKWNRDIIMILSDDVCPFFGEPLQLP